MMANLKKIAARINALSIRERFLLFAAAIGVLGALTDYFFISPLLAQQKALVAQLDKKSTDMDLIREKVDAEMMSRSVSRSSELRAAAAEVQRELDAIERDIADLNGNSAGATPVATMLNRVMQRSDKVAIVRIAQLGAGAQAVSPPPTGAPTVRGGLEITLSGSFPDLLDYLASLERSLPQARWAALNLKADTQPAQLTVRILTGSGS